MPLRRDFLRLSATAAVGTTWSHRLLAQSPPEIKPLNRFGTMMQTYLDSQIRPFIAGRAQRLAAISTPAEAQAYVQSVRDRIRLAFGPFPEKTPLKPRVSGIVDRETYTIEKVTFESRPDFFVTANLYIPKGLTGPRPGVIGSCGHSHNGKAEKAYQSFAQGLARQGYVSMIYDPIGQGERLQCLTDDLSKSTVGPGVAEHLHVGNPQFLLGEFFGSWRAWDGIRALDYFLSRPEVDPQHVGITGNSGGGTLTMWLAGLDSRWTMAAPGCAVTSFYHNFQNELPADTEQCPPRVLSLGLEHGDFLAAMAPKPVIILAQEKDFFDARGSEQTYRELKKLWTLLGAPDNLALWVGPDQHGYTQANREGMYGFFNTVTGNGLGRTEPTLELETDETLQVMPRGQVAEIPSRTVADFSREAGETLAKMRPSLTAPELVQSVKTLLKLTDSAEVPTYRILRAVGGRKFPTPHFTSYALSTEPGVEAIVYRLSDTPLYSRPPKSTAPCTLYVSHHSSDDELRQQTWLHEWAKSKDVPFYTCDVRGTGESRPNTCGGAETYLTAYGNDYFYAAHSIMLDRSYPAQKTHDVLQTLAWLKSLGHPEVHLVAMGWGAIPATFAALTSDLVTKVTLKQALPSYAALLDDEHVVWPLSTMVPGVLKSFDLPDCYAALAAKQLTQLD